MRAGSLDRSVTIERLREADRPSGGVSQYWSRLAELRAQVLQASTEEAIRAYGASTEVVTVFRTRFLDGITPADRVVFDGRSHDIVEIKQLGRRRGLELRTIARGPS